MEGQVRTLAIIPARAGSKGIPGKNTRPFRGKPLAAYAIDVGVATCDRAVVTTDDPAVAAIAAKYKATVVQRPPELAADDTPMLAVIRHALEMTRWACDALVLLQPTSPLRRRAHVRAALRLLEPGVDSVASVVELPAHLSPDYAVTLHYDIRTDQERVFPAGHWLGNLDEMVTRRQDCERVFYRDGSVYVIRREVIDAGRFYGDVTRPLIIPAHESATIDTEEDWVLAEAKNG
jgi:CMP-N,N'-diacetyllegionaminic acid synthase